MAIDTVLNPVGIARRLSVPQLQQAIQDGTIPPYIGIPLLQQKVANEQRLRGAAAQKQAQQPPIAQQVMAEASGLDKLQSNLPTEYAGGGIVAFASGGSLAKMLLADDEEADDDYIDSITSAMAEMDSMRERMSEMGSEAASPRAGLKTLPAAAPYVEATKSSQGVTVKEGDKPAKTVERHSKSVTEPKGIDELLAMIEQKESGGKRFDKYGRTLTSPKGAQGEMQVMPGTARDPGFGIRPAKEGDLDDLARVGREYYAKMLERYGDPKVAAIAYNMGPGATDKWLVAGADPSRLPDETRKYSQGFAEGGIASIKRFQYGGISGTSPFDLKNLSLNDLTRMAQMGDPAAVEELAKRRATSVDPFKRSAEAFDRSMAPRGTPAPAAPAAPAAPEAPARLGPTATQNQPGMFSRMFGSGLGGGLAGPATAVGAGGAAATGLASGILGGASDEGLAQLSSDIGSDTGFAAAIMGEGRKTPPGKGWSLPFMGSETAPAVKPSAVPSAASSGKKLPASPATGGPSRGPVGGATDEELKRFAREQEFGSNIDFEDLERGLAATQMAEDNKPKAKEEAPKESETMTKLRDRIAKGYDKLDKQEAIDNYLALIAGGLGIMGGSSPFASVNIGKGALQGVQSYLQSGASRAAQEKALLSAELGAERYGQIGNLQREQMLMRKELADADRIRKENEARQTMEGKTAALAERQRANDEKFLGQLESEANRIVESSGKLAALENIGKSADEIARAKKKMVDDLLVGNKRYVSIYNRLYPGVMESFGGSKVREYDPKTGTLK